MRFCPPFGSIGVFDCCRIEDDHALLASTASTPVLADAAAAALLAATALPSVLADAAAAALLALVAPPPVLTAAAATLLAHAARLPCSQK